ncbi:MAG: hypothetical protein IPI67_15885 [Myxococcales bacterium]|nr:hypothetical protein [Myxococcales bacterium]
MSPRRLDLMGVVANEARARHGSGVRNGIILCVAVLVAAACGADDAGGGGEGGVGTGGATSCKGSAQTRCAAGCGSDVVAQEICVAGEWRCPEGTVRGSDCPPGTCFGYSDCCGPNGDHKSKICPTYDGLPSPASGKCPDGYYDCQFGDGGPSGGSGGGGGSGGSGGEPPDASELLAECVAAKAQPCAFCCGKYLYSEMQAFGTTLQPCVCADGGPCAAACGDNGFCSNPSSGPSSTCEACLLAQRAPSAACSSSVSACAASAACAPYLDCLSWCAGDGG